MIQSPILNDDEWIYKLSAEELVFVFSTRRIIYNAKKRIFNSTHPTAKNWVVGLVAIDADDESDAHIQRIVEAWKNNSLSSECYACAALEAFVEGVHLMDDENDFSPPLAAKVPVETKNIVTLRGSQISLFANGFIAFDSTGTSGFIEINGLYVLVAGARKFVESAIGTTVEQSWRLLNQLDKFSQEVRNTLS
jgi:hypothetical protein